MSWGRDDNFRSIFNSALPLNSSRLSLHVPHTADVLFTNPSAATQDFNTTILHEFKPSNDSVFEPFTPQQLSSTPTGDEFQWPIQDQSFQMEHNKMFTLTDVDKVHVLHPPQQAMQVGTPPPPAIQLNMLPLPPFQLNMLPLPPFQLNVLPPPPPTVQVSPSAMQITPPAPAMPITPPAPAMQEFRTRQFRTASIDSATNSMEDWSTDEPSSNAPNNKRGSGSQSGFLKKRRTSRSASSDKDDDKLKVDFECDEDGKVRVTMEFPTKNVPVFRKFIARDWVEFRNAVYKLAGINPTKQVLKKDKTKVHCVLDSLVELAKPCPDNGDTFTLHTRKFLAIAPEFYEALGDKKALEMFCMGSKHLICLVCPGKTFNLTNNANGYVGVVSNHPHCHSNCIHPLAYAMIKADLVEIDVVEEEDQS